MWICLNDAFFSIVTPGRGQADDRLLVRARRKGDLEKVFGVPGTFSPHRDYAFRALMERDVVAAVVMCRVLGVDYSNFKDSVRDHELHSAYSRVWSVMGALQVNGPYGARPPKRAGLNASTWPTNQMPRSVQRSLSLPVAPTDRWPEGADDLSDLGLPGGKADPDLEAARSSSPVLRKLIDANRCPLAGLSCEDMGD